MTTNTKLLLADDATRKVVTSKVAAWEGLELFGVNDMSGVAKIAAAEFTLNEMGLTLYEYRHDETLMADMDRWLGGLSKETRENWCDSGACCCMGCVNNAAFAQGISKQQWRAWITKRYPDIIDRWENQRLAFQHLFKS